MSPERPDPDLVRQVAARLRAAGVPSPDYDARLLVEHASNRVEHAGERDVDLDALVARRIAREPLQLLLGRTWFRTVEVLCAPGVFVPRPETEIVAGVAIDAARAAVDAAHAAGDRPRVVEVGTGTGAIACALVAEVPGIELVATDRDPGAVALATRNLARVAAAAAEPRPSRAEVRHGDLLDPVDDGWRGRLDVLVSNPPYLPAADRGTWAPEVADHDPDGALVGGEDGHEVVDALLALATTWLRPGGVVVIEIDDRRGADALAAASTAGLVEATLVRDLTGRDRAVRARRAG